MRSEIKAYRRNLLRNLKLNDKKGTSLFEVPFSVSESSKNGCNIYF